MFELLGKTYIPISAVFNTIEETIRASYSMVEVSDLVAPL
jgi:hypothetical protein